MLVRVVLAYESVTIRTGLKHLFSLESEIEVVGEAPDLAIAVEQLANVECDVLIADVNLPEMSVPRFSERIGYLDHVPRVLIVPSHGRHHRVEELLRAGVHGFLDTLASSSDLIEATEAVAAGRYFVSESINQNMIRGIANNYGQEESMLDKLSNRERQTLALVAQGLTSKEIANQLGLSTRTVETYRQATMSKLNLHKTADLVRFAIREQLTAS